MELNEMNFVELLRDGDENAYKHLFTTFYAPLAAYAFTILQDEVLAKEMAQTVFFNLWKKREKLSVLTSLKSYLYRSLHNACMDQLRSRKYKRRYRLHVLHHNPHLASPDLSQDKIELGELQSKIQEALLALPADCRTIFQLSRFEELSYAAIASQLGISVKTVETQMGRALKRLRVSLASFINLIILFLWLY